MRPWLLWTPVAALTAAIGVFGLRVGWIYATITESDVIAKYAAHYLEEREGRSLTSCHAVPSDENGIWLVVICGENPCDRTLSVNYSEYHLNRIGRYVHGGNTPCGWRSIRPET
ncbi:hypothetical protein [Planktotalea sp.]|uniref:hypothetical protein n=1 Tax=Planktotalea sp. TaxID=2029877 RepID=UPI003D6A4FF8